MATAIYPLRLVQFGLEGTNGTLVAATTKMVGDGVYIPEIDREFETYPRGVRAPVTGGGFAIRKGSLLRFTTNLDYEQAVLLFEAALATDAAPTGTGPYTWTFTPTLTANAGASMEAITIEYVVDDGSTKHYQREAGFGVVRSYTITLEFNRPATLSFEAFFRAEQTSTVTGSLSPISGRANIPSNLFAVYIDDQGGTIGSTQKTVTVRRAQIDVTTGFEPDYTLDGRPDLDFTQIDSRMLDARLSMLLEHNASAATEIGHWRSGNIRLVRFKADNGLATTANRQFIHDGAFKYLEPPAFSQDNGIELVGMEMGLEYDSTYGKALEASVINGMSALPS